MKLSLYIANHLRLSGDNDNSKSPSTLIAIIGIALSLAVMQLSIAVVVGFKNEITSKVLGFSSEVSVLAAPETAGLSDGNQTLPLLCLTPALESLIEDCRVFTDAELVLEQPAILKTDDDFEGVVIKGIPSLRTFGFITGNIKDGDIPENWDSSNGVMLSEEIARRLSLSVGDRVSAAFFIDNNIRMRRFTVDAIYDTYFADYDKLYAFVPLKAMQTLNGIDSISGTRINLTVPNLGTGGLGDIDDAAYVLQTKMVEAVYSGLLDGSYRVSTVNQTGAMYFNWLSLLDTNIVVILIIMAVVSGFTLISSLFIIILQRVKTIGILKALGASSRMIGKVFICIGGRIVLLGMALGNLISILIMAAQSYWHVMPLDPEAYYLAYVPIHFSLVSIILLNICVMVFSWCILLLPVGTISRISPVSTMHYD